MRNYYIGEIENDQVKACPANLVRYVITNRLSDFKASNIDGREYVVYQSELQLRHGKPLAFYKSQGGKLVRNKYRTAITQIREMFREVA